MVEPPPYDDNKIDNSKFKPELSALDIIKLTQTSGGIIVFPFGPIETLSPIKPVGKGRTNTTLINATIDQTDAVTPYAAFGAGGSFRIISSRLPTGSQPPPHTSSNSMS